MACWLVEQWEKARDPRAAGEDRYRLAAAIAENKGIRIDVPDNVPVGKNDNPLTNYSTDELREEIERRLGEKHNDK